MSLAREIRGAIPSLRLLESVSAQSLTTFGAGANAALLLEPSNLSELINVVSFLQELGAQYRVIGNGSNVILPDSPLQDAIIRFPKSFAGEVETGHPLREYFPQASGVIYLGGTPLMNLSRKLSVEGLSGFEFAAGIPGTLGGGIKMNCGAHGASISEVVTGALVLRNGEIDYLSLSALDFSYRHSAIMRSDIVLAASLKLTPGDAENIRDKRQSCLDYRSKTQPLKLPSAGSVFRNPTLVSPGVFIPQSELKAAAWYLEQAGLKGYRRGGVQFSDLHANWLVRIEDFARAEDVSTLIELGKQRVLESFGLELTPEILLW